MPLKKPPIILYKLPAIVFALAILYLAVTPLPEPPVDVPMSDKIAHFSAFLLLGVLSAIPFRKGGKIFLWAFALPVVYGLIIELVQSRVPNRNAEFMDFVADALGAFASYIAIVIYLKYKHHNTTE
ncbi:MAG: VanZ family protein [bacterium]